MNFIKTEHSSSSYDQEIKCSDVRFFKIMFNYDSYQHTIPYGANRLIFQTSHKTNQNKCLFD